MSFVEYFLYIFYDLNTISRTKVSIDFYIVVLNRRIFLVALFIRMGFFTVSGKLRVASTLVNDDDVVVIVIVVVVVLVVVVGNECFYFIVYLHSFSPFV